MKEFNDMAMMSLTEANASMPILLDYVGVFQVQYILNFLVSYRSPNLPDLKEKAYFGRDLTFSQRKILEHLSYM